MKVNILGTDYEIIKDVLEKDYPRLKDSYGYIDESTKKIVIGELKHESVYDLEDLDSFLDKTLRHEIVHAFLIESGLGNNCEWAINEEMVDFFARQFNKIQKAIEDCKSSD